MPDGREVWKRLPEEELIEPDLPICDPHHHLWAHTMSPFTEIVGDHYLLEDFLQDIGKGQRVEQTVFVECQQMYRNTGLPEMRPVGETEFVRDITARSAAGGDGVTAAATGIVGFADLTLGDAVAPVLEAHIEAGGGRFRGIRHKCTWDASADIRSFSRCKGLMLDTRFREGFACLQKYGLSFDVWLYHTQLTDLADLARAFPDTPIIVNHVGGPLGIGPYAGKRDEVFRDWKRDISALKACPNVFIKVGGLGVPESGFNWHERAKPLNSIELAELTAPYYSWCIEQFGVDRCMFESNFPVDKISYSYPVLWNSFKRLTKDYTPDDRATLFHDTAVSVYRLG